jgi:Ca2+-binding RTX toxin-like protein
MRPRLIIFLTVMGVTLLLVSGVALAATIRGTSGSDRLVGSNSADTMRGYAGADTMSGRYGKDKMYGGSGNDVMRGGHHPDRMFAGSGRDTLNAGPGNDYVFIAGDGQHDSVDCGQGDDTVVFDRADATQDNFDDFIRLASCEEGRLRR